MYNNKKILIENGPGIGDIITLTPAIKRFKQLFPESIISIVSNNNCLPIIERLPYIDHTYGIKNHKFLGRYSPIKYFLEQDYVIFFSWQSHLAWASKLINVKNRYGYCREKYLKYNIFHKYIPSQGVSDLTNRVSFLSKNLGLVLQLDLENDGICEVSNPSIHEVAQCKAILKQNSSNNTDIDKYAVIAPFGNTARTLPKKIIVDSISFITKQLGYHCVLINTEDNTFAHTIKDTFTDNVINLCGKTNLMHIVALLKNAQFCLSTDSAPMHISCAVKTPCIAIFSNDSSYKWAPKNYCFPIDLHVSCSPCRPENAMNCNSQICINNITSDMVIKKISALYNC